MITKAPEPRGFVLLQYTLSWISLAKSSEPAIIEHMNSYAREGWRMVGQQIRYGKTPIDADLYFFWQSER
jgi:hypothetical protein